MVDNGRYEADLEGATTALADLRSRVPNSIGKADLSVESRLPFKLQSAVQLLALRVIDLAEIARDLYARGRVVPGDVMTRAVLECTAWLFDLTDRAATAIDTRSLSEFDAALMQLLFGTRVVQAKVSSINVLTVIDRVDRKITGFRRLYDWLSEVTHPNYLGLFAAYSRVDQEGDSLILDPDLQRDIGTTHPGSLKFVLEATVTVYTHLNEALPRFSRACEEIENEGVA